MSIKAQVQVEIVGDLNGGGAPSALFFPEASGQSFVAGAFVYLASGKVTVVATDGVVIYGIAKKAATGTADSLIPVIPILSSTLLSICVYNATAASAITAVASVGLKYPIHDDTTSKFNYLKNSTQSTPALVVQGIDTRDTVGDRYGRYLVTVMDVCRQVSIGA